MADTDYQVRRELVARAYDAWKTATGRTEGHRSDSVFQIRIRELLNLLGSEADPKVFPNRCQRWTEWRRSEVLVSLTRDHCRVLRALTGHDLKPGNDLKDENDHTSVVALVGKPRAKRISNSPNDKNQEQYAISVERIAFRQSDPIRVPKAWLGATGSTGEIDVGSVVFGLRQAVLSVSARGNIAPEVTDVAPDGHSRDAEVYQVRLGDDPKHPGRWVVYPHHGKVLSGSVYLHNLATVWDQEGDVISLFVEAKPDWIEADFQPNGEVVAGDEANSRARKHLIDKVLRLALADGKETLVFSKADAEKAEPS